MKRMMLALLLLAGLSAHAQGPRTGMLRVQGTVAVGLSRPETRYYVNGEFEGLLTDHLGLNGAAYATMGSDRSVFDTFASPAKPDDLYMHSILAGPLYHFVSDRPIDVYVGVQPGFSLVQHHYLLDANGNAGTEYDFVPTATAVTGVAYYGSFFHLFAQARYVSARFSTTEAQLPLGDLRLAIGLGFNFHTRKQGGSRPE